MNKLLSTYGLAREPFTKDIAPADMMQTEPLQDALQSLKAAIEQAVILSSGAEITSEDLFAGSEPDSEAAAARSPQPRVPPAEPDSSVDAVAEGLTFREAKEKFVGDWERSFFINALRSTGGNISRAAERTGMYRQSFQQKMRELGITLTELGLGGGREEVNN